MVEKPFFLLYNRPSNRQEHVSMITALNEIKAVEQSTSVLDLFQYQIDETGQLRLLQVRVGQQSVQDDKQAQEETPA